MVFFHANIEIIEEFLLVQESDHRKNCNAQGQKDSTD